MIKNYLLITIRSMMKNRLFITINILGMGISIACCIVAFFNWKFVDDFDSNHTESKSIYRVSSIREFQNERTMYGTAPLALGNVIRQNIKDIDRATRYSFGGLNIKMGDQIFGEEIRFVDPEFFEMFTFEFIHGSPADIKNKTNLLITDELAMKLFNRTDVVGKTVSQMIEGDSLREWQIGGVYKKQPLNSSFFDNAFALYDNYFDFAHEMDENNWYYRTTVFTQVSNPLRIAQIEQQLIPYTENNNKVREDFILRKFVLDPFIGMAVRDEASDRQGTWTRNSSPTAAVIGCAVMAILVMLIACFNLTNTSLAISSRRLKEIGIRKVMGSMRKQLVFQFIGETTMICFIALLVGIVLNSTLLMPAFNALWPYMKLEADYFGNNGFLVFTIIGLLVTALVAGGYPAFYISKFEPVSILKGKLKFGETNVFSLVLLVMQFSITLIAIVSSIAFVQNAKYQRDINLGFDAKGVVFTTVNNGKEYEALRNEMLKNPDVIAVGGSKHQINSGSFNDPVKFEDKEIETDIMEVGDNYVKTAGLTLLEGRDFVADSETDRKESILVSETFARKMGWDKPIGKQIVWQDTVHLYVVGVTKDVFLRGLWRKVQPLMLRYGSKEGYTHVIVSAEVANIVDVNKYMERKWKEVFPNRQYNGRYMDEAVVEAATVNNNILKMFVFLGAVAMMLSATGLFTLVSLNIIKRLKEIGVRKVLGASVGNITRIINARFAILLLIASLLGSLAGSFLVNALMGSIWAFYQGANAITFAISVFMMFAIAALSIGFKVYNTARMNPVNSLRDE